MKTIGASVPGLLNCRQKPAFNPLKLVVTISGAMFVNPVLVW